MKLNRTIPFLFAVGLVLSFNSGVMAKESRYQVKKPAGSLEIKRSATRSSRAPSSARAFTTPRGGDSKLISYCWTISECNQMISDCISVGGNFNTGITDIDTGATSEGSCHL